MNQMYKATFLPRAEKQLRKIKEQTLLKAFQGCVAEAAAQPNKTQKVGDLDGIYGHGFTYNKTAYRIAYLIDEKSQSILVVGLGSHENFWHDIKKYMKLK